MSQTFDGKTVLITGSARGIGKATAKLAHEHGAKVILHGQTESDQLKALSKELDNALMIACDVADKAAVQKSVQQVIKEVGKIDVLINSAGIVKPMPFLDTTDENWTEQFNINVLGTVHFGQAVIPQMQTNNYGRIVNVASIRGHQVAASNRSIAYSVTKAAIANLTSSMAKEFAPDIAVNAISPGFVNTDISKGWDEGVWRKVDSALSGRIADPSEVAEAILFLASDAASFITGQTLIVDGGFTIAGK